MATQKRRRARSSGGEVKDLVLSLTMDQLRTAAAMMGGRSKPKFTTKEDAEQAFDLTGDARKEAIRCLRLVEARTPGTHFIFYPLAAVPPNSFMQKARARLDDNESNLEFVDVVNDELFCTFEYDVRLSEWVKIGTDGKKKELRDRIVRHPNVARIVAKKDTVPYCVFTYPGFSHGSTTEDYASYVTLAKTELEKMGCSFLGFPVKSALEALVEAGSRKFTVVKGKGRGSQGAGSFSFSSDDKNTAVETVLGPELARHLDGVDQEALRKALARAIQTAPANTYLLFWNELQVTTRIEFWDIGADFLISWIDADRSYKIIDQIFQTLFAAMDPDSASKKRVWDALLSLPSAAVVKLSDLVSAHHVTREEAEGSIKSALSAGILEAVFTIRDAEHLAEPVSWTTKLVSLRREFHREDGDVVDGADPAQVIVGFRRVGDN
jgi:hypothetical protein|nr:hypothetical protein [Kofleriaceae bacterium]